MFVPEQVYCAIFFFTSLKTIIEKKNFVIINKLILVLSVSHRSWQFSFHDTNNKWSAPTID